MASSKKRFSNRRSLSIAQLALGAAVFILCRYAGLKILNFFPFRLCLADLQYVNGLGELTGAPWAAAELTENAPGLEQVLSWAFARSPGDRSLACALGTLPVAGLDHERYAVGDLADLTGQPGARDGQPVPGRGLVEGGFVDARPGAVQAREPGSHAEAGQVVLHADQADSSCSTVENRASGRSCRNRPSSSAG